MSASADELCPSYVSEQRIVLTLNTAYDANNLLAHVPIIVDYDLSACLPEGATPPLEFIVNGPSVSNYRHGYDKRATYPHYVDGVLTYPTIVFTPIEGGDHLVTIREVAHNRWWGCIHLKIKGERLEAGRHF